MDPEEPSEAAAALHQALQALTRLTELRISVSTDEPLLDWVPAALPGLPHLQSLAWFGCPMQPEAALPPGDWLRGLRDLTLAAAVAVNSLPQLQAAVRLQSLTTFGDGEAGWCPALVQWAVQHPSMLELDIHSIDEAEVAEVQAAIAEAKRRKPTLAVHFAPML